MKKKILGGIAVLAVAAVAAWNVSLNSQTKNLSTLSLANVEASADIVEWWNRGDYNCVQVTCFSFFSVYYSLEAMFVGAGNGSVAHTWSCKGC